MSTIPAPVTVEVPTTVWVLVIDHRHGTDASVFRTEEAARAHLAGYVAEWWGTEFGEDPEDTMPEDANEAILAYFESIEDESYTLTEAPVMG